MRPGQVRDLPSFACLVHVQSEVGGRPQNHDRRSSSTGSAKGTVVGDQRAVRGVRARLVAHPRAREVESKRSARKPTQYGAERWR